MSTIKMANKNQSAAEIRSELAELVKRKTEIAVSINNRIGTVTSEVSRARILGDVKDNEKHAQTGLRRIYLTQYTYSMARRCVPGRSDEGNL